MTRPYADQRPGGRGCRHHAPPRGAAPRSSAGRLAGLAASLLAGCGPGRARARTLEVIQFRQNGAERVLLNEALVVHFSAELDPASVTRQSVVVASADGSPAAGELRVDGRRLWFQPRLPRAADYSDAGLRSDTAYVLSITGFPRLDGVRGADGEPLAASWTAGFRTAAAASGSLAFEDATVDGALPLALAPGGAVVSAGIRLVCAEPLDPASLRDDDFQLLFEGRAAVPVRATLARNDERGAEIALASRDGEPSGADALEPGTYHLWIDPARSSLRDLGGHRVLPEWLGLETSAVEIEVSAARTTPAGVGWLHEAFDDARLRSPERSAHCAGTADWNDGGRVELRYPLAAGSGADGRVVLAAGVPVTNVQATELSVPASSTVVLPRAGPVVLCAQGRIEIDGELLRALDDQGLRAAADYAAEVEGGDMLALSAWVEALRRGGEPWTVLVAGGDLEVRGSLRSDGPVLLAAGGWIRISGDLGDPTRSLVWRCPDASGSLPRGRRATRLVVDCPALNPLAAPLTAAVLSAPVRPSGGVARWHPAILGARHGLGEARVSFFGERDVGSRVERVGPVADPSALDGCSAVRFLVELTMPEGPGRWDPPSLDFVELSWDPAAPAPDGSR